MALTTTVSRSAPCMRHRTAPQDDGVRATTERGQGDCTARLTGRLLDAAEDPRLGNIAPRASPTQAQDMAVEGALSSGFLSLDHVAVKIFL
ncbi:hypothetical protein BE11_30525 [Sorangium cellulosum]|nr:hypothetical protein BE11_30525 [Sorangium cellulosum]